MSAANKILTVSYGTFSCTIEGFEDPFGTMKQIAEYFRDLAAEDRYFGAEPPVPDAEALRHIAERETTRRVEARMASGGVHLRRLDDAAAAASATPVAASGPDTPESVGILTPSDVIDPAPSSVAERLSRIRAVVARARNQPLWPDEDAVAVEDAATDAGAVAPAAFAGPAETEAAREEVAMSDAPDIVAFGAETRVPHADAPAGRSDAASAPAAAGNADAASGADDTVGTELAPEADVPTAEDAVDLAAVAAGAADADVAVSDPSGPGAVEHHAWEGGHPEVGQPAGSDDDAAMDRSLPEPAPGSPVPEYVRPDLPIARVAALRKDDHAAADATDRIEAFLAGSLETKDLYDDEDAGTAAPDADDGDTRLLDAIRAIGAGQDVAATEPPTDRAAEATGEEPVEDAPSDDSPADIETREIVEATGQATDPAYGDPWQLDTDGPAVLASDTDESGPSTAVPTERDDLVALEEDSEGPLLLREADDTDADDDNASPDDASERIGRATHEQAVEDLERRPEDASVDRLLAATNSQLESTEVNRRRSAIAHLKAAVAAARADRRADDEDTEADDPAEASTLDKFREDLARVVRPRRPVDQEQARPSRRLPPLMLVSEQRIDLGSAAMANEDAVAGPVRPRRVVTRDVGDEDLAGSAVAAQGGFADFAESMGARDLPDMIEAAAAYTAFVEGRPSFSRPQLMQMMRVGDSDDTSFSREEQLRSFGLLLRQGRIQKLKRGQFTVADDTRFRPPHRHAGE